MTRLSIHISNLFIATQSNQACALLAVKPLYKVRSLQSPLSSQDATKTSRLADRSSELLFPPSFVHGSDEHLVTHPTNYFTESMCFLSYNLTKNQ